MQTDQFAMHLEDDGNDKSAEETIQQSEAAARSLKHRQLHCEVHCACLLRQKLDRLVYGKDKSGFAEQMRLEAVGLASGQFGPELLATLVRRSTLLRNSWAGSCLQS